MSTKWFKPRRYRHLDLPVNDSFARKITNPAFVCSHIFLHLIHYEKTEVKYKKDPQTGIRSMVLKERPIKYASHRDACILSYYNSILTTALERHYSESGISTNVVAYRSLGQANYHFSADAFSFAVSNEPVKILAFDVTKFFDTLDHSLLKARLKRILAQSELSTDWYKIYRSLTNFHYIDLAELKAHEIFGQRLREKTREPIASVEELKAAGISFHRNPEIKKGFRRGIPQGTPISASLSNLYMIEFDANMQRLCDGIGAFYRRYSDDVLVICSPDHATNVEESVMRFMADEKLELSVEKTERTFFGCGSIPSLRTKAAQYLGFTLAESGAAIRESSLSRQWRKMRRAIRRTRKVAIQQIAVGTASSVYTKKLFRRFTLVNVFDGTAHRTLRNFSSYGRRSADVFGANQKIASQIRKFERAALKEIDGLRHLGRSKHHPPCDQPG